MGDAASTRLCLKTLGPFEVLVAGAPVPNASWPRRKTKDLLKVLLTAPGEVFTVDQLIDALLPDADVGRAGSNIRARVSELRAVLEPDLARGSDSQYVRRVGEGYSFACDSDSWIDSQAFERGIVRARRIADAGRWEEATERFEAALGLSRGEFLAEDRYAEWAEAERSRLRALKLDALSHLASCYAELGRLRQAISCCQAVLGVEPHRESAVRQLMEYQHTAGHRVQALNTYTEGARALREQLDVDPAPETRALFERIRSASGSEATLDPRRIAVLPFANYSPDPEDEYFADGMTEELIGCLAKVLDLRVIARTSVMRFKGSTRPVSEVARALDVGSVLEGSVRKAGDRVRICAQLIDAGSEEHVWSDEYEGDLRDAFAVQKNTAREVARALEVRLASGERQALSRQSIDDVTAHTMYLKGRFFLSQRHVEATMKGREYLEQAVRLDPSHARAFAALADSCVMDSEHSMPITEAYEAATSAVTRALSIDETLAEAQTTQALIKYAFEGDLATSRRQLERVIARNPSYCVAYDWLGFEQVDVGEYRQAIDSYRTAITLDPLSPFHYFLLARACAKLSRFDEAFSALDKALELHPGHTGSLVRQVWCCHLTRAWTDAAHWLSELERFHGDLPQYPANLGLHQLYLGDLQSSHETLRRACAIASAGTSFRHHYMESLARSLICARRFREAVELMEQVIEASPFASGPQGPQGHVRPLFLMAMALELEGRAGDALATLDRASQLQFSNQTGQIAWTPSGELELSIWIPASIGMVGAGTGDQTATRKALDGLRTCPRNRGGQSARAVLCFRVGLLDEGFEALNLAVDSHDAFLLMIKTHPWFDPVRDDPRLASVLERMDLTT